MQRNRPAPTRAIDAATLRTVPLEGITPRDLIEPAKPFKRPLLGLPKKDRR